MVYYALTGLLMVAIVAFFLGNAKAVNASGQEISSLHSRPAYHGGYLAILSAVPGIILLLIWSALSGSFVDGSIQGQFAQSLSGLEPAQKQAFMRDVRTLAENAEGAKVITSVKGDLKLVAEQAAEAYAAFQSTANFAIIVMLFGLAIVGFIYGYTQISKANRTRHFVEKFVMALLVVCSAVAILTTIGIVFSLIFESFRFFQMVPLFDFLFGYHWSPQSAFEGAGRDALSDDNSRIFGAIPLFLGTF
ncbi:MAG: phosphate ABC transporter permease family protein, partial [Pseudomonadota bacterium]